MQSARGNLEAALKAYQDGLAIREKLAAQDPSNTEWQRDLSVSFDRIGDVQSAQGNLEAALQAYQDGLAMAEKLAAQDRSNAGWQRDLIVSMSSSPRWRSSMAGWRTLRRHYGAAARRRDGVAGGWSARARRCVDG